jgi:glc operon protein GlcG
VVKTKRCLTLDDAKKIAAGCEKEALARKWAVTIAIVDDGGHLLWLQRLDGAPAISPQIATGKARTAALFGKPTKVYEDMINNGRYAALTMPAELVRMEGGEPVSVNGEVVGAVGVSGVKSSEDAEVARAGINHFLEANSRNK